LDAALCVSGDASRSEKMMGYRKPTFGAQISGWVRRDDRWIDLLALLVYVLLSLAMSYPLLLHMSDSVAGRHMDTRVFQWNDWWVRKALLEGRDLYHSDYIYYPSGVSLTGHNFNWVSSFLSVPLSLVLGPGMAYNLTFLFTLFMSGFSAYSLTRYLVRRRDAAFVAGLVFAFSPYHISGNWAGQMNLANVQWLPLFVLFLLRAVDGKRIGDAVLAGLFFALASLDCWFFAVFLCIWGGVFLAYSLLFERKKWSGRVLAPLALAAVGSGLLIAPFLLPVLADSGQGAVEDALGYYEDLKSTDLLAFVTPSSDHPLLTRYTEPVYGGFSHWRPAFLGYASLLLALYGVATGRRRSLLWALSGLLFAALALGAVLRIGGVEYPGVPTPYGVLTSALPALKILRQTNRFNVMVSLSLSVLVGLGCADLFARLVRRLSARSATWGRYRVAPLAAGLSVCILSAWVLFEYLAIPCPLLPYRVSPFYDTLAQEEGDWAILELPSEFLYSRRALYAQTFHGKRVVNGYVARAAPDADAFVYSSSLLKALQLRMTLDPELYDVPAEIGLLAANRIRYVLINKMPMPPHPAVEEDVLASWRVLFGTEPVYEDQEIVVYRTQLAPGQTVSPSLRLGDDLGLTDVQARRTQLLDEQFLTVDLTWVALRTLDRTYQCQLSLLDSTGEVAQSEVWRISPHYPTSRWKAGVVVAERYAIALPPSLPGGDYRLAIAVADAGSGQALDTQAHQVRVAGEAVAFAPILEDIQLPVDVTFGDQMWLLGVDLGQDRDHLVLDVYWQVLRTMGANYKVFVHLIRPADGAIVAQQDAMPRGWSYPTSLWSRQEVFVDRVLLDASGVEPGEYQVALGVYRPETGRLDAMDREGSAIPDGRAVLSERITVVRP
jgi:hypothetical protein